MDKRFPRVNTFLLFIFYAPVSNWSKLRPTKLIETGWNGPEKSWQLLRYKNWGQGGVKRLTQALLVLYRYLLSLSILTKYSGRQLRDRTRSWFGLSALVGTARTIVGHQTICYPACHNRPDNTLLQHPVERSAKAKLQAGIYAGGLLNQSQNVWDFRGYQNCIFPEVMWS